jgi:sterol desaturase/sphingolipid hydroxylase (fatty acid hydroxylase superfamily)
MNVLTIGQSKAAYWADFVFYGATILVLAVVLVLGTPHAQWPRVAFWAITGVVGWSALEYLVHRFLFHGVQPFRRWHAEHHARPTAFICAPTIVTASVLGTFLFLPTWLMGDVWSACALTLGVLFGYVSAGISSTIRRNGRAAMASRAAFGTLPAAARGQSANP